MQKKCGVAKSTIQRYENGKINTIKIPVVESIAIALNVKPSWIVGKSEEMELPVQNNANYVNAAHAIDTASEADKQFDENIMDDENF